MAAIQRRKQVKWEEREELREKGQFWTPQWVAVPMVRYALSGGDGIFDPAVGPGAFARALKSVAPRLKLKNSFRGCEIDPVVLERCVENGLVKEEFSSVELRDFLTVDELQSPVGIVANPPYIRHHRISAEEKARLQAIASRNLGHKIDGRAGVHVFFLLHALTLLAPSKRLAFIVPADVAEGVFATSLWQWILSKYRLDAVVRFAHKATPFPGVDTNPLVLFIENSAPRTHFLQATCGEAEAPDLDEWVAAGMPLAGFQQLSPKSVPVEGASLRGVGRDLAASGFESVPLSSFARTLRGIATGANDFFFMTSERVRELGIPLSFFIRAVGRTRDVDCDQLDSATLASLDSEGKPTYLLSIEDRTKANLPESLVSYLEEGEMLELDRRALISQRNPWFRMEQRRPPEFLFAYLGRRNARFIKNSSGAVPLTGFLCVYPLLEDKDFKEALWLALCDERTVSQLVVVGKTYGGGAIKVEPRALANLPIPMEVVRESGLLKWLPPASALST